MQETRIQFDAGDALLEGRLATAASDRGVVITHPHPQYGGDMDNAVVQTIAETYQSRGWSTLRFNFRGAGNSRGSYGNGKGEAQDLDAAIERLKHAGMGRIELAGYSFGAWVISLWAQDRPDHGHTICLVAPPVAFLDYGNIRAIDGLRLVVVGGRDDIAPPDRVADLLPAWQPDARLQIIETADHFFWHQMKDLEAALSASIAEATG